MKRHRSNRRRHGMPVHSCSPATRLSNCRSGATLMDVLMSLGIMGIGIVSLAALFPLSIVRAIQATQMTHATNLRLNAEAMISVYPNLIHDPDFDGNYFEHHDEDLNGNGIFDAGEEDVNGDGQWSRGRYIVDPFGWNSMKNTPIQSSFGNDGAIPPAPLGNLVRFNGGFGDLPSAVNLVALPDSWSTEVIADEVALGAARDSATLTNVNLESIKDILVTNLAAVPAGPGIPPPKVRVRAVFEGLDGKESHVREITNSAPAAIVAGTTSTLSWAVPLPNTLNFADVSKIRIQVQQQRYTWLLTVRNTRSDPKSLATTASVDLVVFANRGIPTDDDEIIYPAHFPNPQDLPVTPYTSSTVTVKWAGLSKPFVKKGGFIFDAENAYWYRIQDYREITVNEFLITIDRPAIAVSTDFTGAGGVGSSSHITPKGGAILMRGIIEVFPLGSFKK